ncbi:hypothetical protein [Flavobacterium silvaticum]|uniref:Uncharacterized protein n=1 Tax=Flavobacterium silvaticum TaxID=1852020 RepID=A0A972G319_9FLAO|nr:hypothetical protein [Flavobacterium silvaticum]NMH29601.1 hypothetical protein [Flavobacterium silvaticum]
MKNMITVFGLLLFAVVSAQVKPSLNQYKYAVVPAKFSFLKERDQYMLNTYTKMHLHKYGFEAYLDDEDMPMEAMGSKCGKVYVNLLEDNNMFTTKIIVQFKDCLGNILYTSEEGTSRIKEYPKAYREALSNAFKSFETAGYAYDGTKIPVTDAQLTNAPKAATAVVSSQSVAVPVVVDKNTLFAQPTENGYQLVDTTPSVVFKLQKTSSREVFMAQKGDVSGTLINKDGVWTFEFYKDGQLSTEQVKIKF